MKLEPLSYLHDLFGSVREVFFDLLVLKFEYLETVLVRCLGSLGLGEVVNHALVWIRLLDIFICEVNYHVPIWKRFPFDSIRKNDFFFTRLIDSLYLAIVANNLVNNF